MPTSSFPGAFASGDATAAAGRRPARALPSIVCIDLRRPFSSKAQRYAASRVGLNGPRRGERLWSQRLETLRHQDQCKTQGAPS
jgi:hypothetical protein